MKKVSVRKTTVQLSIARSISCGTTFDFEIGTLTESPCRCCEMRSLLPTCIDGCEILSRIQTTLAGGISSGHSVSPVEDYCLASDER
jgi:hypothetical protein